MLETRSKTFTTSKFTFVLSCEGRHFSRLYTSKPFFSVCVCVLHVLGCSKQTRSFSKNTREGGYPSNQDTRERKQKKYEKQGGNMSMSKVDGREKESKGTLKEKEKE